MGDWWVDDWWVGAWNECKGWWEFHCQLLLLEVQDLKVLLKVLLVVVASDVVLLVMLVLLMMLVLLGMVVLLVMVVCMWLLLGLKDVVFVLKLWLRLEIEQGVIFTLLVKVVSVIGIEPR